MNAPPCDAVGCPEQARWISAAPPDGHFDECLCEAHMALLKHYRPDVAASYRQWTVFIAQNEPTDNPIYAVVEERGVTADRPVAREPVADRSRSWHPGRMMFPRTLANLFR